MGTMVWPVTEDSGHIVPLIVDEVVPLARSAGVGITGGGIMGTSIAFHLAEAGVRDVVVIERNTLGSGSSAKPLGGVRATFSDPVNIQLGQRSLETFERFRELFKIDIGLQQVGYLFLCRSQSELAALENATGLQNSLGCSARMVTPEEAVMINPLLRRAALRFRRETALPSRRKSSRPTPRPPNNSAWHSTSTRRS